MIEYELEQEMIDQYNKTQKQAISIDSYFRYELYCIYTKYINSALSKDVYIKKVSLVDIAVFCKMFAVLSESGLSVSESLNIIMGQMKNVLFKRAINRVYDTVQKGGTLSKAMEPFNEFPKLLVHMVKAGEASGQVGETFRNISLYYEKQNAVLRKIRSAYFYPVFISFCAIGLILLLIFKILPEFISMFSTMGAKLPSYTLHIISISNMVSEFWPAIIITITLIIFLMKKILDTDEGHFAFSKLLLTLPVVGPFLKIVVSSRFSGSLSILLKNGMNIIQALDILADTIDNPAVGRYILSCRNDIEHGQSLCDSLSAARIFPELLVSMVSVGEECGTLEEVLHYISAYYEEYMDNRISRISSMIEPFIMIILGVIVCSIIMSVMIPMMDMYKYIN